MRFPRWLQARLIAFHVWLVNNFDLPVRATNKRQRKASVLVNYFGANGMPPLRSYKPSRLPYDVALTSLTMGAIEPRPVALAGQVVVRRIAPLFVRTDHRLVDANELGRFTETVRALLADPDRLGPPPGTGGGRGMTADQRQVADRAVVHAGVRAV